MVEMKISILVGLIVAVTHVNSLKCDGKADVVIAVAGAPMQVPQDQFIRLENFLIGMVNYYDISKTATNVGLILYGRDPQIITRLTPSHNKRDINTRISLLAQRELYRPIYGGSNVVKAIDAMIDLHKDNKRPGTPKIGVIITYGAADLSGPKPDVIAKRIAEAGARAKKAGIEMFAVSSGGLIPGFEDITSGDRCRLFSMSDFQRLHVLLPYLASTTCYVTDPGVTPSTSKCFPEVLPPPKQIEMTCPPPSSGFYEDKNNCAYFIQCTETGRIRTRCAGGTLYDPQIERCNHKEFVTCWSKVKCPQQYGLFPHPHFCNQYLNCAFGVPYVQTCPAGLVFNKSYCDYRSNVDCGDKKTSHQTN
ncbi:cartilage matrix protein [Patella vulgata]|uniref:cartilage matrix protein n=1 Tax=Patella vulgata TaxID=6465 RepID=UPI00217FF2C5|nr:cartilage matrix protein [Patella vulgata]XP_050410622.1 cartilage matrix protein [Patella vulgata]XP_050410623.1 cartilage matrix protein [Patella vulgata]